METNKILTADVLDIIFDGRNKQYGAYDLRKSYNSRLTKALLLTAALALLIFLSSILVNAVGTRTGEDLEVLDTQLAEVKKETPPPPPPPPPPPVQPPPPPVNQIKFTPPKIVKDEEVKPEEKLEEIKDDQKISDETIKSDVKDEVKPEVIDNSAAQEVPVNDNEVFTKVENEAEFPGGNAAWARYLEKALGGFNPADNGAGPGKYQVIVKFIVSKDGSISDVHAETNYGSGMEEQAVKCIKNGPKWKPALQNGRNVNAYRSQPVTFIVEEQ